MFVWTGGCLYGQVDVCMVRWVFVWICGYLYGQVGVCMDGWVFVWMGVYLLLISENVLYTGCITGESDV